MNLITTASYYGSGSSAITDLLEEYDNIGSLGSDFECRIAHDMFGLSDLEYYLVDNFHRHNSSTAINKFLRLTRIYGLDRKVRLENYPEVFGNEFRKAVEEYISSITVSQYKGGSHVDIYEKSDIEISLLKLKNRIYRKIHKTNYGVLDTSWSNSKIAPLEEARRKTDSFITFPRDSFLEATVRFTDSLFSKYESEHPYLVVDQLVPATNTMRYTRYFSSIKVICMDRDPRDIYYLEKKFWKGGVVPTEVKQFVEWYRATREHKKYENDDPATVLRMNFEDLIYDYEESVKKIELFLGIESSHHVNPKSKFNPEVSVKNTRLWENDQDERDNLKYIEDILL